MGEVSEVPNWISSAALTGSGIALATIAKLAYTALFDKESGVVHVWLRNQLALSDKLKTVPDMVQQGFETQHKEDSEQTKLLREMVAYQTDPKAVPGRVVRKTDLEIDAGISVCDSVEAFWDGDDQAARAKLNEARELLKQAKGI